MLKKVFKFFGYTLLLIFFLLLAAYAYIYLSWRSDSKSNLALVGDPAPVLTVDNYQFRDLNKNGNLDIYEDTRASIDERIQDLIGQMTLEEKAGMLFITFTGIGAAGELSEIPSLKDPMPLIFETNSSMIAKKKMNSFNIMFAKSARQLATWTNNMQKLGERTRLGIPITIGTDPRHGSTENPGASIPTSFFSSWCSPLGLAATRDSALVYEFGDIARQEYLAVGLRLALHPMADLATEPRWARANGTFGEDAQLSAWLTKAYVRGFQGDTLNPQSVACMTKHFSGGGPQANGRDAHFASGKGQAYPGNHFAYHVIPFSEGALPAHTAQIMPYYGIPEGQTSEEVAFGFNKDIITGLLRDSLKFDGVVCTDWGIVSDMFVKSASAWGVEHLTPKERVEKVLHAGCDMFGGETVPHLVVELVNEGRISEKRIDQSVYRILRDKFVMGLFDDPYVDTDSLDIVGNDTFVKKGEEAQRRSLVLLKNENTILPLDHSTKVYIEGMTQDWTDRYPNIVNRPTDAEVIILKTATPYETISSGNLLERFFHQGSLAFPEREQKKLLKLIYSKPTITIVTMDRPPVMPMIDAASKAVIADFECQEDIILDLIFGKFSPSGKLPYEIPSSMAAVKNQKEDVPYDSENPLYPFGHGLSYETGASQPLN